MEKQLTTFGKRKRTNWYTVSNQYDNTQRLQKYTPPAVKNQGTQVNQLMQDVRNLKKRDEMKNFRVSITTPITTTTLITPITAMIAGVGNENRIGNRIKLFSISLQGILSNSADTTDAVKCRIAMFIDWRNQGVLPLITDIWDTNNDFKLNQLRLSSSNKMSRFTLIYDEYFTNFSQQLNLAGTAFNESMLPINKFYRRIHHHAYYTSGSAGITAVAKGAIFLAACSFVSDADVTLETVIKYTDS